MMEITYRRNPDHNYMIIRGLQQEQADAYAIRILEHNSLPGLLPVTFETMDEEKSLVYDITSMQSMTAILNRNAITAEYLRTLFHAICLLNEKLKEYLLPPEGILLQADCIFQDLEGRRFYFCYHPFQSRDLWTSLREIMDLVLNGINYQDPQLVQQVYELHAALQKENLSLPELEKSLETGTGKQADIELLFHPEFPEKEREKAPAWTVENPEADSPWPIVQKIKACLKGIKTEAADSLKQEKSCRGILKGTGANAARTIFLTRFPFSIGRSREADCCLPSGYISRMHARIYREGEREFRIEDLDSTNGTTVNDRKLKAYVSEKIEPGDRIGFANQEYLLQ